MAGRGGKRAGAGRPAEIDDGVVITFICPKSLAKLVPSRKTGARSAWMRSATELMLRAEGRIK